MSYYSKRAWVPLDPGVGVWGSLWTQGPVWGCHRGRMTFKLPIIWISESGQGMLVTSSNWREPINTIETFFSPIVVTALTESITLCNIQLQWLCTIMTAETGPEAELPGNKRHLSCYLPTQVQLNCVKVIMWLWLLKQLRRFYTSPTLMKSAFVFWNTSRRSAAHQYRTLTSPDVRQITALDGRKWNIWPLHCGYV